MVRRLSGRQVLLVDIGLLSATGLAFAFGGIVASSYANGGSITVHVNRFGEGMLEVALLFGVVLPVSTLAMHYALAEVHGPADGSG